MENLQIVNKANLFNSKGETLKIEKIGDCKKVYIHDTTGKILIALKVVKSTRQPNTFRSKVYVKVKWAANNEKFIFGVAGSDLSKLLESFEAAVIPNVAIIIQYKANDGSIKQHTTYFAPKQVSDDKKDVLDKDKQDEIKTTRSVNRDKKYNLRKGDNTTVR